MLRTENIFLHTRNSMKKEDLRRDKDIRRLEKKRLGVSIKTLSRLRQNASTFQRKRLGVSTQTSKRFFTENIYIILHIDYTLFQQDRRIYFP